MNCLKSDAIFLASNIKSGFGGKNEVVLCPPFTLLASVSEVLAGSRILLGAQNCHFEDKGAFTGEVSARMLADAGASYVIVGHSERRAAGETDAVVRKKAEAAVKAGLKPIICIGESGEERKAGKMQDVIKEQMEMSLPDGAGYVIAYEPIWAIGTGLTPTLDEIAEAVGLIKTKKPQIDVLYGGSVTDSNCVEISNISNISGFLVGGASLDAEKFSRIMNV